MGSCWSNVQWDHSSFKVTETKANCYDQDTYDNLGSAYTLYMARDMGYDTLYNAGG